MSIKGNFQKAFKELITAEGQEDMEAVVNAQGDYTDASENHYESSNVETTYVDETKDGITYLETQKVENQTTNNVSVKNSNEVTIITKDTIIKGSISCPANINIAGVVKGDVECDNSLVVSGKVEGQLNAAEVLFNGASVKGNVHARGNFIVNNETVLVGDIHAKNLDLDGKVKGNLCVKQNALLRKNTVIVGDISAFSLSIQEGAVVQGRIETLCDKQATEELFSAAIIDIKD